MTTDRFLPPDIGHDDERDFDAEHDPREDEEPEYNREEKWERDLARRERDEADARYFAAHPEPKEAPPLRPEPEYIAGIPFYPDPKNPTLSDLAQCGLCGQVVDVGGEMRDHIDHHDAEQLEAFYER